MTHYIVERRETSRVVWSTVSDHHEQTHISVGKLLRGNEYVFRVMGVNKYGVGEALESEPVVAKNAFGTSGTVKCCEKYLDHNNLNVSKIVMKVLICIFFTIHFSSNSWAASYS